MKLKNTFDDNLKKLQNLNLKGETKTKYDAMKKTTQKVQINT